MMSKEITIVGGGLAGCEAAWQAARRGAKVRLYEMKPHTFSPAHELNALSELVCSNSFRSDDVTSAVGLLKEEMRRLGSLIMQGAEATSVPAGKALAVDRQKFAEYVTREIEAHDNITVVREELQTIPPTENGPVVLATGPLTSSSLADNLAELIGSSHLAFYDAIAPIIDAQSLNMDIVYRKSRWDDGPGDYLNCPMNEEQYTNFITLLTEAKRVPLKEFEDPKYFEGCLPIEVMLERGEQTLLFGPMKPVGLHHPETGEIPYAAVQLRAENREQTMFNMVGFQTKLTYSEQKRVFRAIPGLEQAEFVRLGSIHRNTFVCAPEVLEPTLQMQKNNAVFLAGQLSGVEGYVESTAMGLLAGINSVAFIQGKEISIPPAETAHGALIQHLTATEPKYFQPSNVNFGLFPPIGKKMKKRDRGAYRSKLALEAFELWLNSVDLLRR